MISLKWLDKPKNISKKNHDIIIWWMWWLITNNHWIKDNEWLFAEWNSDYKTLDMLAFNKVSNLLKGKIQLKTKAMWEYLMWKNITIPLIWTGHYKESLEKSTLRNFLQKHYLYPFFKDKNTIPDNILYMWNDIFKNINIQVVSDSELNFYMSDNPMDMFAKIWNKFNFEYYLDYSRDKLLQKEVELWYTNKTIWDPERWYWYTHLLRRNVSKHKLITSVSIRAILNWTKINFYITTRFQWKTNFAADRVVAELLSDKGWFGSSVRRIKFFTDNASTVWDEMMWFIKEYLWDFVTMKNSKWQKYFSINETKQEIVCHITWNTFKVVSIFWLKDWNDSSKWDWMACDCWIIDEWFRISERFWKSFKDRAFGEADWILFISTFNEETELSHWWYNEMIKWEAGCDPLYNTVRSSSFDHSVDYLINFKIKWKSMLDFSRSKMKELKVRLEETDENYIMKRLLCWVLSDKLLFDVSWRIIANKDNSKDDLRIIWLDMWWLEDPLWICVFNAVKLEVEIWEWRFLKKHEECLEIAKEFKDMYPKCIIVWDMWWPVWELVYILDKDHIIDYWIKNWTNWIIEKKDHYLIWKWLLVISWSYALSNIAKIMVWCSDLIGQFGDMEWKKSKRSNTILYKAKNRRKDDAVFAFIIIFWLLRIIWELLTKEEIVEFARDYEPMETLSYTQDEEEFYYSWWMTY